MRGSLKPWIRFSENSSLVPLGPKSECTILASCKRKLALPAFESRLSKYHAAFIESLNTHGRIRTEGSCRGCDGAGGLQGSVCEGKLNQPQMGMSFSDCPLGFSLKPQKRETNSEKWRLSVPRFVEASTSGATLEWKPMVFSDAMWS